MEVEGLLLQLREHLNCPLCRQLYTDPHRFDGCGHVFCYNCVLPRLEGPGVIASQCPTCQQPGWKNQLKADCKIQNLAETARHLLRAENVILPAATSTNPVNRFSAHRQHTAQQQAASISSASKRKATPEEPTDGAAQPPAEGTASTAGTRPQRQKSVQRQLPSDQGGKASAAGSACLLTADRNNGATQQPGAQSSHRNAHCSSGSAPARAAEGTGNGNGQGPGRTGGAAGGEAYGEDYWVPDSFPVASGGNQVVVRAAPPNEALPGLAPLDSKATPLKELQQLRERAPAAEQGPCKEPASGGRARSAAYMQRRISALGKSARKPEAPKQRLRGRTLAPAGQAEALRASQCKRKGATDRAAQVLDAGQKSMRALGARGAVGSRAGADQVPVPEEQLAAETAQAGAPAEGVQPAGRAAGHKWVSAWVTEVATTLAEPVGAAAAADEAEGGAAAARVQEEGARLASGQLPEGSRAARKSRLQALMAKTQRKEDGAGKQRAGKAHSRAVTGQAQGRARKGSRAQRAKHAEHTNAVAAADGRSTGADCGPAALAGAAANLDVATNTMEAPCNASGCEAATPFTVPDTPAGTAASVEAAAPLPDLDAGCNPQHAAANQHRTGAASAVAIEGASQAAHGARPDEQAAGLVPDSGSEPLPGQTAHGTPPDKSQNAHLPGSASAEAPLPLSSAGAREVANKALAQTQSMHTQPAALPSAGSVAPESLGRSDSRTGQAAGVAATPAAAILKCTSPASQCSTEQAAPVPEAAACAATVEDDAARHAGQTFSGGAGGLHGQDAPRSAARILALGRTLVAAQGDVLTLEKAVVWEAERAELEAALAEVEGLCRERGLLSEDDEEAEEQQQQQQQRNNPGAPQQSADCSAGVHAIYQDASLAALLCSEGGGLTAMDAAMEARGYRLPSMTFSTDVVA